MTLSEKQRVFARNIALLILWAYDNDYEVTFGEAFRPQVTQDYYLKNGQTRTKNSKHTKRLAVDFNLFKNGKYLTKTEDYTEMGQHWMTLHKDNVWGGSWKSIKDGNHFEMV